MDFYNYEKMEQFKEKEFTYHNTHNGLFSFRDAEGYINLKIEKIKGKQKPITTFSNHESGKSFMNKIVEKNQLCQKLCGLDIRRMMKIQTPIIKIKGSIEDKRSPQGLVSVLKSKSVSSCLS